MMTPTDDSENILLEVLQRSHRIKIINMSSRTFGTLDPCVLAGFETLLRRLHSLSWTLTLQDPPELPARTY